MEMTNKQALIFTSIMCFFMVLIMSAYNILLYTGYTQDFFLHLATGFLPGYICAFICDVFIVARPAKAIAFKLEGKRDNPFKTIITISFFMVCGMVLCMSLFGALVNTGFSKHLFATYCKSVMLNFIIALPIQLLVAGPLTRKISQAIFQKAEGVLD